MFKNKVTTDSVYNRRNFIKLGFFFALPNVIPSLLASLTGRSDGSVSTFTRVSGNPHMTSDEFNKVKPLWIDSARFSETIRKFQHKGLILRFNQTEVGNSSTVDFVFISKEAKLDFDSYLVKNKIFQEQKLIEIGLIHETGIS